MALDIIADVSPPERLPFGNHFVMPAFRVKMAIGGNCLYREMVVPLWAEDAFHKLWKKHLIAFLSRGYAIQSFNGKWTINQHIQEHTDHKGVYTLTAVGQEKLDIAKGAGNLGLQDVKLDLSALPSELEAKLLDYQIEPARQLLRALACGLAEWGYSGAWDCSDLGTGKTYTSLAAALAFAAAINGQVFVICPISVIGCDPRGGGTGSGWRGAFAHFNAVPRGIYNYETLRTGNRDFVKWEHYFGEEGKKMKRLNWTLDPARTVLVFDEAHKTKVVGTQNQALAMAAMRQRFPTIFTSGTLGSDPTHMRATGRAVGLHKDGQWLEFLKKNGCYGNHPKGKDWKFIGGPRGQRILQHLHYTVFPARGARIRIQDLGDRFPETQVIVEAYQTKDTQGIAKAFRDAEHAIERLKTQGDISEETGKKLRMNYYMDAWHASERAKVCGGLLEEMCEEELEEGRSVAIFMGFTDTREELMRRLKTSCGIFGTQPLDHRNRWIGEFQADRERVIVCQIAAGGVGVSLHDINGKHPRTAIILPHNSAEVVTQALGRVHRSGGRSKSRQIIPFAAGTVEEEICSAVRRKMAQIDTLNDGDLYPPKKF